MAPIILTAPLEGWVTALDTVPDPVFAGRMMGDGVAIDPTGDTLHAPCAGRILNLQATRHAVTIEAENGARILIHIGIDTVALDGRGFTALVAAGDRVSAGDPLIRFDLDLLVREARAVVTPILLTEGADFTLTRFAPVGMIMVGAPLMTLEPITRGVSATSEPDPDGGVIERRTLMVDLPHGIHARPAARIAALARTTPAALTIEKDDRSASARSLTGLLGLGIGSGDRITIVARGDAAATAVDALVALIATDMYEAPAQPSPATVPLDAVALPPGAVGGVCAAPGLAVGPVQHHRASDIEVALEGRGAGIERDAFAAAVASVADGSDRTIRDASRACARNHAGARGVARRP